jgi:Membrane domain of glycerophosphoryl diester phosphodiesterase
LAGLDLGPGWQWPTPTERRGLGVGGLVSGGLRLYRRGWDALLAIAVLQTAIQIAVLIPTFILGVQSAQRLFAIIDSIDPSLYRTDPTAYQVQLQAMINEAMTPLRGATLGLGLIGAVGLVVAVIAWELYTCVGLDVAAGTEGTVVDAWRTIVRRPDSFIFPAVLLAAGYTLVTLPLSYAQATFVTTEDPMASGRAGAGLGALGLLITIAAIYLGVRWSLAIPAMAAEGIGLRASLGRSSELTRGIRLRITGALIVMWLLTLLLFILVFLPTVAVGLGTGSLVAATVVGGLGFIVVAVIVLPWLPSILVVAYLDRTAGG